MCKQKSEWYDEFINEIIMFECHECGHIEDADEEYMECPECESEDFHMETSTAGMECGICNSYLPTEEGEISYSSMFDRKSDGKAHQYICVDCYNELVEQEENLEYEMEQVKEDSEYLDTMDNKKIFKTYDEMQNVYDEEIQYFVSRYYPEHEARAHNDRWIEPARWETVRVDKYEYEHFNDYTYKQNQSYTEKKRIHVPYDKFVERWESKVFDDLDTAESRPNLKNVTDALFGLKQYFYILKVRINGLLGSDIDSRIKKQTTEATINIILEKIDELEKKQVTLLQDFDKKSKKKDEIEAEKAEKERLEEIAKLEERLKQLKGE